MDTSAASSSSSAASSSATRAAGRHSIAPAITTAIAGSDRCAETRELSPVSPIQFERMQKFALTVPQETASVLERILAAASAAEPTRHLTSNGARVASIALRDETAGECAPVHFPMYAIAFEGGIGHGKSELVKMLSPLIANVLGFHAIVISEYTPSDELKQYYEEQLTQAARFQLAVLDHKRAQVEQKLAAHARRVRAGTVDARTPVVLMFDRHLASDHMVFFDGHRARKYVDERDGSERRVIDDRTAALYYDKLVRLVADHPYMYFVDAVIKVECSVDTSLANIRKRKNPGEDRLTREDIVAQDRLYRERVYAAIPVFARTVITVDNDPYFTHQTFGSEYMSGMFDRISKSLEAIAPPQQPQPQQQTVQR